MANPCPEVSALKNNEELLVESLLKTDLERLSREALEIGIIPQDVKNNVASLDLDNVPRGRAIRYLLMHGYKRIEGNSYRLYERWINVLSKHVGTSTSVLDTVRQNLYTLRAIPVQASTLCLAEDDPVAIDHVLSDMNEASEDIVAGSKRRQPQNQNLFTERHISPLTKILAACAGKWYELSIALNLPENVRIDIRTNLLLRGSIACFNKLLWEWIVCKYDGAKDHSVENLEEALRSQMVGFGQQANQLRNNLIENGVIFTEPMQKKPRLEGPALEIVSQSYDTTVTDGMSILLEVQAVTNQNVNISYQWLKDDCKLEDGNQYSGIHESILCINKCDLSSKGSYTCEVSTTCSSRTILPIALGVDISLVKKVLVDRYSTQPEVPEDSWPPTGSNTYINLALIKPGNIEKAGEYVCNTIQGNMDDIMTDKESVDYDKIFTDLASATRFSGKTTLVHRFSQDWARGNSKLNSKNIKLLFHVHLRGFLNDSSIELYETS